MKRARSWSRLAVFTGPPFAASWVPLRKHRHFGFGHRPSTAGAVVPQRPQRSGNSLGTLSTAPGEAMAAEGARGASSSFGKSLIGCYFLAAGVIPERD